MAQKKKNKVELPESCFIEDCIWMSYRYCIGRHTIAAAMHAPAIAKFLDMNPTIISEDRKRFIAKDIREEINDALRWRDDILIRGTTENVDIVTLILRHVIENQLDMTRDWRFEVNLRDETVTSSPVDGKPYMGILHDFSDLMPWVKLANWLDPQENITYQYEGETKTEPGFTFYTLHREVIEHHVTCDAYIKNPYIDTYIAPEYILNNEHIHQA